VSFRSDDDALLARNDALEQENARLREELAAAKALRPAAPPGPAPSPPDLTVERAEAELGVLVRSQGFWTKLYLVSTLVAFGGVVGLFVTSRPDTGVAIGSLGLVTARIVCFVPITERLGNIHSGRIAYLAAFLASSRAA
jgi:hypothetical protein